jgi:hypothetical protein
LESEIYFAIKIPCFLLIDWHNCCPEINTGQFLIDELEERLWPLTIFNFGGKYMKDRLRLLLLPLIFFATVIAIAGITRADDDDRLKTTDINQMRTVRIVDSSGTAVLSGSYLLIDDDDHLKVGDLFEVPLERIGSDDVDGIARIYFHEDDDAVEHDEIEVDVDDLSPNTTYSFYINDVSLITFTTDDDGDAELEWEDD